MADVDHVKLGGKEQRKEEASMSENKLNAVELSDDELNEVIGGKGFWELLRKNKGNGKAGKSKNRCQFCGAEIEGDATGKAWLCASCLSKMQTQL